MSFLPPLAGILGALLVVLILWDAFETILVPRRIGRRVRLTSIFYSWSWRGWRAVARRIRKQSRRESLLGYYAPLSIILLLGCWAAGLIVAFALLELASARVAGVEPHHLGRLLYLSGETFFTLGFGDVTPATGMGRLFSVIEAGLGFGFLGTVIGYLPTMYSSFSQREIEISLLDARAGSPPTAAEVLHRLAASGEEIRAQGLLRDWERWSAQALETHISYPLLAYYRSQHSNQSWLSALTVILDSTALMLAGLDGLQTEQAQLTFATARHALVDITQIFVRPYTPGAPDRLPRASLARLRAHLAGTPVELPDSKEFEEQLASLRLMYEPYAQALAEHLLLELPPWIHAEARKDNWRGGPWDKALGASQTPALWDEDHF